MPKRVLAVITLLCAVLPAARGGADVAACSPTAPARVVVAPSGAGVSNGCVTRVWSTDRIYTAALHDDRTGFGARPGPDFRLNLDGVAVTSDQLLVTETHLGGDGTGRASIRWKAGLPGVLEVDRTVEVYSGIAGFAIRTSITALAPVPLSGYTLDEIGVGGTATPSVHEFRAGSDWRDPSWNPPSIGDNHAGDWREAHTTAAGQPIRATGEWATAALPTGQHVAIVNERRDYASSVGGYDGVVLSAGVDFSRDVVYLGPFEESGHVENPTDLPARHKILEPSVTLDLERAFTVVARDADDEAWQYSKYLTGHRLTPYPKRVIFNSDKVDSDQISTGAKDDMNFARFEQIIGEVREMGVDTFVFDDGWMARSGDWCPDSPDCPEPRYDPYDPATAKFGPRFPDSEFAAVRDVLRGDPNDPGDDVQLGLWMNPMSYHPSSKAFQTNPQWSCAPVGTGTGAVSIVDPDSSSNEAGIGLWNPRAMGVHPDDPTRTIRMIDYLEERIRRAIDVFGSRYFKFDFLVWVDCAGAFPVTMYEYHDEFVAMLDRLQADHPEVTFQIDDTNDHRMFPFETISRGPSWYLNGGPSIAHTLHTVWTLAPYVPGHALGLRSLSSGDRNTFGIDAAMAAAITSHLTFSFPVDTDLNAAQRAQVRKWTDFYHANSATLTGFTYPLLADPNETTAWTALQPWDRDAQSGWVLAYRQTQAPETVNVTLRGLDAAAFRVTLVDPATGTTTDLGVFDRETLRTTGVPLAAAAPGGYAFARIEAA